MREYDIKRGHWKNLADGQLLHLMQDIFEEVAEEDDLLVVEGWGAFNRLTVEYVDKTTLRVDTDMNVNVGPKEAQETIRKWNDFLELATGFDTKSRKKRAEKKAKKS